MDVQKWHLSNEVGLRAPNNDFGHYTASLLYESLMEIMLANLQCESCEIYLDDVIAFGNSFDEEAESSWET